ncbi:MAG: methylated-DNA--[protein]-cysteine S-methyltransferase, partial [Bacteroidota bacterium]
VKTTSVFCIASCSARKPKKENVIFYTSVEELLQEGFRPCKICKPTENAHEPPDEIQKAIRMVQDHPKEKISDQLLREAAISPENLRRWFKKHYGMTFHKYQRMYRINQAYLELRGGKRADATAFDSGYESLSGFGYTYKKLLGKSPQKGKDLSPILINRLTTPLGPMFVCATEKGICLLEFVDRKMLETEFQQIQKQLNRPIMLGENTYIRQCKAELNAYFSGKREIFEVALDHPGTKFQQEVWRNIREISYGETTTYSALARRMGNPTAVRAIAAANGANRIAIILPCHRIIGKDGKMRGYGGGIERKKWLLAHERKHKPIGQLNIQL